MMVQASLASWLRRRTDSAASRRPLLAAFSSCEKAAIGSVRLAWWLRLALPSRWRSTSQANRL